MKGADGTRIIQQIVGRTSTQTVKEAGNCPITTDDIKRADAIYGPNIKTIQGKSTRRIPDHHKNIPRIPLPYLMVKNHNNVELTMDFSLLTEALSYTQNQGRNISGYYKHAPAEEIRNYI